VVTQLVLWLIKKNIFSLKFIFSGTLKVVKWFKIFMGI